MKLYELTDEEIIRDCDCPACVLYKTPQESHMFAAHRVAKAAQKKLVEWLGQFATDGIGEDDCVVIPSDEWKSLLKNFGIGEK